MDRATVIVALPPVDDRVNKISSEKVAHLTMLYLGDVQLSAEAVLYVQHACAELSPFMFSVDHRGKLGPDEADVLFFEKNPWDMDRVAEFRHHLLLNDEIKMAYDAADQYPEWTPHLTLGYPEAPANDDEDGGAPRGYVNFDRIAIWTGDFEGPEFRLKYNDSYGEVAMSDMTTTQLGEAAVAQLFHYGKKGMKWGVRNDKGHEGERVKTKQLDKLDKKWEKDMERHAYMKLHNAAAEKMNNGGIDAINNSPKWKDVDFRKPENEKLLDEYYADHENAFQKAMVEAGPSLGMNPSGTKAFVIKKVKDPETGEDYDDVFLEPVGKDIKHEEGEKVQIFRLTRNETGHITEYIEQEAELKHYGVKGMRWGVTTKDRAAQVDPQAVTITQKKPGTFAKAEGGKDLPLSADAKAALELRQKAKASTTDALSNQELQAAIQRMNLEQQYSNLTFQSDRRSKGEKFVQALFGQKRYGKKRVYTDDYEELGDKVRKGFESYRDEKQAAA